MTSRRLPASVVVLFALSGVTGIVFEVLWIRIFTSILGSSTQSVGAVVASFMLGIALGQAIFGRRADRATSLLGLYARLELGVATFSLVTYWLFLAIDGVTRAAHRVLPEGAAKWGVFALAFVVVTVPATLVGGTLPVLVKRVLRGGAEAREGLGRLYGVNTLGAALGALGTVFLVKHVGYDVGYHVAVALSAATGLMALVLSRREPAPVAASEEQGTDVAAVELDDGDERVSPRALAWAFALSGCSALALEVLWQRLLDFYFQATLESFAWILAVFLGGVALGSVATRRWNASVRQFVVLESFVALLSFLTLPVVTLIGERDVPTARVVFLVLVFAVTFLFGAIFPLVGTLYAALVKRASESSPSPPQGRGSGRGPFTTEGKTVGDISSFNTLGSVFGSLAVSFVLIPLLGTPTTLVIASLLNVAAATLVAFRHPSRVFLLSVLAVCAGIGFASARSSPWVERFYLTAIGRDGYHLIAERESSLQPVTVLEDAVGRRLLLGGPFESGEIDEARRQTQRLQAHLPMLLHPNPRRVLEIGYGVGEIPRTVMLYRPEQLTLAEIDPMMIAVANDSFGEVNGRVSEQPGVVTHVMDGRQYLRVTDETFDVILTDSMIPVSELSLRMYALEHFQAGRARLNPGGVMVLWLPLYIGADRVKVMLRTFLEAFPDSLLWLPQGFATNEAFVVGFRDAAKLDLPLIRERFAQVAAADLAPFGWQSELPYLASFLGGRAELEALTRDVSTLHRDRAPVLDFIPTADEQGLPELLQNIYARARPVALDFAAAEATDLRANVLASIEADRAFQQVKDIASLEAMFAKYPTHPTARLTAARLRCAAKVKTPPAELEAEALQWLELSPADVCSNLVVMRAALGRNDAKLAAEHARRALILQPYLKEARAVLEGKTP
ncbi:MAG: hypothetical protein QM817_09275 [Archangium sp.]